MPPTAWLFLRELVGLKVLALDLYDSMIEKTRGIGMNEAEETASGTLMSMVNILQATGSE